MWRYLEGVTEPAPQKTNAELLETLRCYKNEKRNQHFQDAWAKIRSWLSYNQEKNTMVCTICQKYDNVKGAICHWGSENFKKKQPSENMLSLKAKQKNALRYKAGTAPTKSTTGSKTIGILNKVAINKLHIFRHAHYVAKLGRPYTDYVTRPSL